MKFLRLVSIATAVVALQIPLRLKTSPANKAVFADDPLATESSKVHYSKVDPSLWPVDLNQYQGVVIRGDLSSVPSSALREALQEIENSIWSKNNIENTADIQISYENLVKLLEKVPQFKYSVMIDDLAQKVYESYPHHEAEAASEDEVIANSEIFFKEYRSLDTIYSWLDMLQQTYPEVLAVEDIGETYEGRPIRVVHFSVNKEGIDHSQKKSIVVTGGTHAREWISVSSTLFLLYKLLNHYEYDPTGDVVTKLNILFVVVENPDGYEYTWNHDRLWRKNRQKTKKEGCFGIDIDHSYDYHWTKSTDWECGEEYSGEYPFEAYESKIWNKYLNATNEQHKIYGYIDLHSYSQEVLYPYAYSCNEQPRDEENLVELAYGIAKAVRIESGQAYNVLPACIDKDSDMLPDMGSGSALDYMYHSNAYWAYQLKLRDTGSHGFLLPSQYIVPVGMEIYAGLKYFVRFVVDDDR
ncbi:hypothetical protein DIURU_005747 [Diutina rugosa]|uniref:Inactive metallocarboxypeptidase ECM14 n=1 Tax=Diutina rugosa TaxID=5481 RepID=A0A642UCL1_DIURU|nr:uncharacterized protein DIURU_005747 [Diutina rugosa]KAA8896735.1 hypothetical protein DIURU_005747 [Diutina rugosa]